MDRITISKDGDGEVQLNREGEAEPGMDNIMNAVTHTLRMRLGKEWLDRYLTKDKRASREKAKPKEEVVETKVEDKEATKEAKQATKKTKAKKKR